MPYSQNKKAVKEVRYLNKDFASFKANLIEFAKIYFPNTYNDFNEASPGMMFIEMASYVGDVLSYYVDNQFKESLLSFAQEKRTVYNMAQTFGYKPKLGSPSTGELDVFQTVPAISEGTGENFTTRPDLRYAMEIKSGMILNSSAGVNFTTVEDCNFKFSSSYDPMEVSVYESSNDIPVTYLLKKSVKIESGNIATDFFSFGNATKFDRVALSNPVVTEIISCIDDDGNEWYPVDYLAQDTVFEDMENNADNDPELAQYADQSPYLLKLLKTSRRFTTFIREDGKTELRFGAGISDSPDEEIIPNPNNVGSSLPGSPTYLNTAFDPSNFLNTKTYGQAPSNTTLTVRYRYGGGVDHNALANSITSIVSSTINLNSLGLNQSLANVSRASLAVTNPDSTTGGKAAESIIEVKNNTLAYFQAQQRAVTKADYITRVYALPPKYGNVAKAYIVQDTQIDPSTVSPKPKKEKKKRAIDGKEVINIEPQKPSVIPNPLAMNLYVLGFDANKKLISLNQAVKENIQLYITQFRMMTDAINIKNAFVINIGVKCNILTKTGYNKEQVILQTTEKIAEYFDIEKWQIGQPIVLGDIAYQISLVDGVSSVVAPDDEDEDLGKNDKPPIVQIVNKHSKSDGYSGNLYDVVAATKEGVVYPSMDPSCFELKYPNIDIEVRVVGDSTGGES